MFACLGFYPCWSVEGKPVATPMHGKPKSGKLACLAALVSISFGERIAPFYAFRVGLREFESPLTKCVGEGGLACLGLAMGCARQ